MGTAVTYSGDGDLDNDRRIFTGETDVEMITLTGSTDQDIIQAEGLSDVNPVAYVKIATSAAINSPQDYHEIAKTPTTVADSGLTGLLLSTQQQAEVASNALSPLLMILAKSALVMVLCQANQRPEIALTLLNSP